MTWLSYSTKALTLFGVLPLVLKKFSAQDMVVWYIISTIIALQAIADFGFRTTFSRLIAYAYGGAASLDLQRSPDEAESGNVNPNTHLLAQLDAAMKFIYKYLSAILLVCLLVFGTWAMIRPVNQSSHPNSVWIGWAVVVLVSIVSFYTKIYLNFLEGLNKIALVRRVETLTSGLSIISSILVLVFFPSVLNLIIVNQFWLLAVAFRDWYLCRGANDGLYLTISGKAPVDKKILRQVWQPAWRSGISGLMSTGLTNATGLIYAQFGNAPAVAGYLLAIRIINQVKDVSMAPFYSKLPLLARLRVQNNLPTLTFIVKRGMMLSHLVFVSGFIVAGLFTQPFLHYLHSQSGFVTQGMWILLGVAFFIHRFGAMHIQVYISTNHVISHIADGISGLIYIIATLLLLPHIGLYAVPVAMIAGYLGFYSWYAARYSYRSLNTSLWQFEKQTLLLPVSLFLAYFLFVEIGQKFA